MGEELKTTQTKGYAENAESFSSYEYGVVTGKMESCRGGLLSALSLEMPEMIAQLDNTIVKWPVAKKDEVALKAFLEAAKSQKESGDTSPVFASVVLNGDGKNKKIGLMAQYIPSGQEPRQMIHCVSMDDEMMVFEEGMRQGLECDSLTGALTRGTIEQKISQLIETGEPFAFVMMDVDGFKLLNDTCGHPTGDRMLKALVQNIKQNIQPGDLVARIGGDEFVVCMRGVGGEEQAAQRMNQLVVRTRWERDIYLSTSMGISFYPTDGSDFEELYHKADIAMYCAKAGGGDSYKVYQEGMLLPGAGMEVNTEKGKETANFQSGIMLRCSKGKFEYPAEMGLLFRGNYDDRPLWQVFLEDRVTEKKAAYKLRDAMEQLQSNPSPAISYTECRVIRRNGHPSKQSIGLAAVAPGEIIITITDIKDVIANSKHLKNLTDIDQLTGCLNMNAFARSVTQCVREDSQGICAGEYAMLYTDIVRFKAINDTFGSIEGDKLLMYLSRVLQEEAGEDGLVSRMSADRFVAFVHKKGDELQHMVDRYFVALAAYPLVYEVVGNMGIYVTTSEEICVEAMIDRANIAFSEIKGNYAEKFRYFDEEQRNAMLGEQEIVGMMTNALAEGQFLLNYQPQYDHTTKQMVGAEALVRWKHPERGIISPAKFIPIFERNGFISKLDMYVFEQVCIFLRKCMDQGMDMVPISVNRTRYDIYQPDFVSSLEKVRRKYDVPAHMIHIEITETVLIGGNEQVCKVIGQLHECGYVVEMDDFGSGYSSLNTLKDINLDVLKLDMDFLTEDIDNRGGTILSSVVRMAKWLGLPVIAEGVESLNQADYLQSIGCNYLQGYLYARPMPEDDFHSLLEKRTPGETEHKLELIETLNPGSFWNPESLDTLIFSNYVGGAAIFDYYDDKIEIIRVNQKYEQEVASSLSSKEIVRMEVNDLFDEENRKTFVAMLNRAIESGEEEECETWRSYGDNPLVCIRSNVRVIGKSENNYIFYERIRNITSEKQAEAEIVHREKIFRAASEQVNIYYWEYDVKTKEMTPCFRCMRDLGLPPLVTNYPEPAIEMGIFPPEVAELYREMHRKIEAGVAEQEVNIPLTPNRVMFRVRYTTEFDENGKPIKAYGSAAII